MQVLSKSGTSGNLAGTGDQDVLAAVGTFLSGAAAIGTSDVEPVQASPSALPIAGPAEGLTILHASFMSAYPIDM